MRRIRFRPLDGNGELMKLKRWIAGVRWGTFVDSDGFGEYAMEDAKTSIRVHPRHVYTGNIDVTFTHIVWYDR